jgi:fructose-1,6-bisphosphatase/inositol monophosphatase family enzyme
MNQLSTELITRIKSILIEEGEFALNQPVPVPYQLKPDRSPYTRVELEMEDRIVSFLRKIYPDDQVISEEHGKIGGGSARQWFLDPIDGTKVYLAGLPTWGISLGLFEGGMPSLGFFYLPKSRDMFWGGRDFGAFFNDIQLDRKKIPAFDDPLVFLGVAANFHRHYTTSFPRLRALGSTAIQLCYVSSGVSIGALTRRVNLWDLAGVLPILAETGAQVEFLSGKLFSPEDYLDGSRLPEELLISKIENMEKLRGMIHRINS